MKRSTMKLLKAFFVAKTTPVGEAPPNISDRYVPLAYSSEETGWGVFDRLEKRYVEDEELETLSAKNLMEEKLPS